MLGFGSIAHVGLASLPWEPSIQPVPPQPAESVVQLDKGGRLTQIQQTGLGPTVGDLYHDEPEDIEFLLDSGGAGLSIGLQGYITIPLWLSIRSWTILAPKVGSLVVDVWKVPLSTMLAGTLPTSANSICGSAKPTLSAAISARSSTLTGWTTIIRQGDILAYNIVSVSGLLRASLILNCVEVKLQ